MGPIVVTLVAILIMLLVGVVVAGARLGGALRRLRSTVAGAQDAVGPTVAELNDAGQTANVEVAELRASIDALTAGRRAPEDRRDDARR